MKDLQKPLVLAVIAALILGLVALGEGKAAVWGLIAFALYLVLA